MIRIGLVINVQVVTLAKTVLEWLWRTFQRYAIVGDTPTHPQ